MRGWETNEANQCTPGFEAHSHTEPLHSLTGTHDRNTRVGRGPAGGDLQMHATRQSMGPAGFSILYLYRKRSRERSGEEVPKKGGVTNLAHPFREPWTTDQRETVCKTTGACTSGVRWDCTLRFGGLDLQQKMDVLSPQSTNEFANANY